jgi:hypothetical protein
MTMCLHSLMNGETGALTLQDEGPWAATGRCQLCEFSL